MARFALAQAGVDQHSHDRLIAQLVHARECRHLGLEAVDLAGARGAREGRTMNPTDLARRWKPYRNAVEGAEKAATVLQEAARCVRQQQEANRQAAEARAREDEARRLRPPPIWLRVTN
jgi:hypothetical protein